MEETIIHMAKFGIDRMELRQKVNDCNLIKLPTNLKGFSCDICEMLDTNEEKEFLIHVKEECKVMAKEERVQHLVCFCRGCHARFGTKAELGQHVGMGGCWPGMMVVNRLYDMSGGGEVASRTKDKVVIDREKMVRVKQEKLERAHQIQVKRERFEQVLPQVQRSPSPMLGPQVVRSPSPSQKFNAYSFTSSQGSIQAVGTSTPELQRIMQSVQPSQVLQSMQASSYLQEMDTVHMQQLQGIQQLQFPHPSFTPQPYNNLMPTNFSIPSPYYLPPHTSHPATSPPPLQSLKGSHLNFSPTSHTSAIETVKTERRSMPEQSKAEPSPAFSPLRESHRAGSRSTRPSEPVMVPPPPSTPLPTLDDLFTPGGSSGRQGVSSVGSGRRHSQKNPSGASITSYGSVDHLQAPQSIKLVNTSNCQRSACLWTDPHSTTCIKLSIMAKCSTNTCNWFDKHRNHPLCDKLSFYCNCKKVSEGVYKYYDSLPQVRKIPTEMEGTRDSSVKEPKHVVLRLLYRTVSKVVADPRLSQSKYPATQNIPARSFSGKGGGKRGWGEDCVICTWSGLSMVVVRRE